MTLAHLIAVHLVHLLLLGPAVIFGLGVVLFSRRRPAWDVVPATAPASEPAPPPVEEDSTE